MTNEEDRAILKLSGLARAKAIHQLMGRKGFNQAEAARYLGVGAGHLSRCLVPLRDSTGALPSFTEEGLAVPTRSPLILKAGTVLGSGLSSHVLDRPKEPSVDSSDPLSRKEVVVEYQHPTTFRLCTKGVERREYLKLTAEGRLRYQIEGSPRPRHYPDPELWN